MSTPTQSKKSPPNVTAAAKTAAEHRNERLAAQLRANLRKRKALARSKDAGGSGTEDDSGPAGAES